MRYQVSGYFLRCLPIENLPSHHSPRNNFLMMIEMVQSRINIVTISIIFCICSSLNRFPRKKIKSCIDGWTKGDVGDNHIPIAREIIVRVVSHMSPLSRMEMNHEIQSILSPVSETQCVWFSKKFFWFPEPEKGGSLLAENRKERSLSNLTSSPTFFYFWKNVIKREPFVSIDFLFIHRFFLWKNCFVKYQNVSFSSFFLFWSLLNFVIFFRPSCYKLIALRQIAGDLTKFHDSHLFG